MKHTRYYAITSKKMWRSIDGVAFPLFRNNKYPFGRFIRISLHLPWIANNLTGCSSFSLFYNSMQFISVYDIQCGMYIINKQILTIIALSFAVIFLVLYRTAWKQLRCVHSQLTSNELVRLFRKGPDQPNWCWTWRIW